MSGRVVVVDYGMGNLLSVRRGLESRGGEVTVSSDPEIVATAERLLLPGVGAFKTGMDELRQRDLIGAITEFASTGRPLLGICLGMQMLFTESEEFGRHAGLNLIPGRVVRIPDCDANGITVRRIPSIGWGALKSPESRVEWSGSLLEDTLEGEYFYFIHSYMAVPDSYQNVLAECDHSGVRIAATVKLNNVMGCQFHPEKSGEDGLRVLERFLQL